MSHRLLLVEDQAMVGSTIEAVLQSHGFEVEWVQHGEEALRRFQETPFELILTDIELPRMNGIDLLRHVRQIAPQVRVVVMSGSGPAEPGSLLQAAREEGATATLTKPFRFPELVEVLREALVAESPAQAPPVPHSSGGNGDFSGEGLA